ncbi:Bacterial regulatory protein, tetR family [Enhygromyxa salina]|uniref:Bacterial regulatory protein, tetR family n=1 Tax=Enhygromyxa salina TaxID=215803 RepID=A0A2S9XC50_9BACT|nr:TetR family transcriptional regulator [Enhygromyxa salina]PRP90432.1 Bacterial regulatory protein, tetR family [Enhygromyxa salina]
MSPPRNLRDRKKAETRARILACAHELFHEHGFDSTTVEDICAAVSVSKRTFFRYFPDKDSLVFPNREMRRERFVEILRSAPPEEAPFDTFRRVTRLFAVEYSENRDQLLAAQTLIVSSPTLLAAEAAIDREWERDIADMFIARLPPGSASERRAEVLAGAMIGTVRATMRHWYATGGVDDLDKLGQEALDSLEGGFGVDEPLEED